MTNSFCFPKVTVAISLYNYSHYIERAIQSVCTQTIASSIELIIVDDASTDNSVDVVRSFQHKYSSLISRLTTFHHEIHSHNRGLAEARNTAFHLASSPNILVLDVDNFLFPQTCECLFNALNTSSRSVGAVYPVLAVHGHPQQRIANELPWAPHRLIGGNYIDAFALVRREAWRTVGGFIHTPGGWEDFDFWCRFVEHGLEAKQVPKILGVYSHHSDSMKNTETNVRCSELTKLLQQRYPWLQLTAH